MGLPAILIVDKPLVCQRICPTACKSNDLRPAVGGGNAFFPQTQAFALQKMPEMTYTPSFLIRASFFRDFVNTLNGGQPHMGLPRHCQAQLLQL